MLAPKGFSQELTGDRFVQGHRIAAEKRGALRYTFPMSLLSVALTIYGARAIYAALQHRTVLTEWLAGALLIATGIGIAGLWLIWMPHRIKITASARHEQHRVLYGRTAVSFTQDSMTLQGECVTRTVLFAKTRLCVETATLFVLFTDDGAVVLLDKEAFDAKEETTAFLRDVCARRYKKKGSL